MRGLICLALLTGCASDETLTRYAPQGQLFILSEVNDNESPIQATLELGPNGALTGEGPCNRYNATIDVPYPWFHIDAISATRMACPDLDNEVRYFDLLSKMTLSEFARGTLILSNDAGQNLVFTQP
ncbi:MAG: META domain-containing protein [Planktomarina sp.]